MEDQILQQILSELKSIKSDVSGLKADVSALKAGQQKLEAEITGIKSDISGMKSEIADIKKDTELIPFIKQAVSELSQEGTATTEKVEQVQEKVVEHESILELLATRSIVHEAKLKGVM